MRDPERLKEKKAGAKREPKKGDTVVFSQIILIFKKGTVTPHVGYHPHSAVEASINLV